MITLVRDSNLWDVLRSRSWGLIRRFLVTPTVSFVIQEKALITIFLDDNSVSFCKLGMINYEDGRKILYMLRKIQQNFPRELSAWTKCSDSRTNKVLSWLGFERRGRKLDYNLYVWSIQQQ